MLILQRKLVSSWPQQPKHQNNEQMNVKCFDDAGKKCSNIDFDQFYYTGID